MKPYCLGLVIALTTVVSSDLAIAAEKPQDSAPKTIAQVTVQAAPSSEQILQQKLQQLEQKQHQLEQEIEGLRQQITAPKPVPPGVVVPVVVVPEDRPQSWEISTQVLFLKPTTSNLMDFAIVDPGTALAVSGDLAKVGYDRAAALRVGVTYHPPQTAWAISASHTFLDTDGSNSAVRPTNGALFATFTHPFQNDSADTASARSTLGYNATDIELAYNFQVGKSLDMRVFGGLRFSDVNQEMTVDYNGRDFNQGRAIVESSFSGFGPRLGAEAKIRLASDLSLFGRGAGTLLLGSLSTRYDETDNAGADVVASLRQDRNQQIVPGMDLAIGLNWQPKVSQSTSLNFSIGYEYQHLFNVADSIRFVSAGSPGVFTESQNDLSLQGFFLRLGLSSQF